MDYRRAFLCAILNTFMQFKNWFENTVPAMINNAVKNAHGKVLQQLGPAMIKIRPETNQLALQLLQSLLPTSQIQEVPGANNLNDISIDGHVINFHAPQPIFQTAIAPV